MNHKTNPPSKPLPCEQNPGDWFDQDKQDITRQQCVDCTNRSECAAAALRTHAPYGMWAGVWIDDDLPAKRHLFEYTLGPACGGTVNAAPPADDSPTTSPPLPRGRARRRPVGRLHIDGGMPQISALITARSSGHCEIMAPACTYQQAAIFSRYRGAPSTSLASPAGALAACLNCIELIEHTELPTALDLGYVLDSRTAASATAVFWRQHRWVYLDARGGLRPCPGHRLTASA